MRTRKPPLTYANVVSTIALFLVLGGGAYATIDRKVGPKDIRKNAVKKKQLAPRAVNPVHINRAAVRTPKIFDGAVTEEKLAPGVAISGPQGPQGEQGPQGPQGEQGPPGPSTGPAGGDLTGEYPNPLIASGAVGSSKLGTVARRSSEDMAVPPNEHRGHFVECAAGEQVLGGGAVWPIITRDPADLHTVHSFPVSPFPVSGRDGWSARMFNGTNATHSFRVIALCLVP